MEPNFAPTTKVAVRSVPAEWKMARRQPNTKAIRNEPWIVSFSPARRTTMPEATQPAASEIEEKIVFKYKLPPILLM